VAMLDRAVDPVAEGFDVVIADANLPVPSSAIARPVLTVPLLLCAAPAYLAKAGVPSHPADLQGMDAVTQWQVGEQGGANEGWTLHHQDGSVFEVTLPAAMRANNYALSLEGVVRGLGVGRFTPRMLSEDLAQGTVQRILPDWTAGALSFNMIYPSRRLVPVRVRTFIDSMVAQFDSFARQRAI
jgi:DNA-binding transcriptional LysR family regulator